MSQKAIAMVPDAIVEAVNKVIEHYGEDATKAFYSADGEAIVHYRTELGSGVGSVHFIVSHQGDDWVLAVHTIPGHVEPGLPGRFNAGVMYDTRKSWWPVTCKHCGREIEDYGKPTGWVEIRSGDEGGYYDVCPENMGTSGDPQGDGHVPQKRQP